MRVAVPVFNGRVSPVFDTAQRILLVDIEDGVEVARVEQAVAGLLPWQRARVLSEKGAGCLICGAISCPMMNLLQFHNIETVPNIAGDVDEVLGAYIAGTPLAPRFMMPGCCGRGRGRGRFRRGRGRRDT